MLVFKNENMAVLSSKVSAVGENPETVSLPKPCVNSKVSLVSPLALIVSVELLKKLESENEARTR